jgi:amidase
LEDAQLVATLRKQGAIILGKTNLTELACFKSFDTVNGFSSLAGYVLCPWNTEEDPSGSSTGSAVSMALGLAPVAIGTETGGSIMSPSMKNGVVGLKPTIGLISRRGIVPISSTLDTAGPMGRTVTDVAALLSVLSEQDEEDPITQTNPFPSKDYTAFRNLPLTKKRIGIDKTHYDNSSPKRQQAFDRIVSMLEQLGCTIVDNLDIKQTKRIYHVMKYEFKNNINHYLYNEGLDITLFDIVRFNEQNPPANLKYGQKVLKDALHHSSGKMVEEEYLAALNERTEAKRNLEAIFTEHKLDMIYFASYTSLGPHCGFPTLSLPVDFDEDHMPIGTYFLAPYWQEGTLIQVASNLETTLNQTFDPLQK